MELMQPKSTDPQQQQTNAILKVLPLMIGWFSLSVPAALSVYWVTNNIVTTASTLWIRSMMPVPAPKAGGVSSTASASTTMTAPTQSIFTPLRDKPAGFGEQRLASSVRSDGVKPITVMDAEIEDEDDDDDDDDEEHDGDGTRQSTEIKKKRRKSSKKKRK
jgi:YidC/Oxa1 family membrane protein insertase